MSMRHFLRVSLMCGAIVGCLILPANADEAGTVDLKELDHKPLAEYRMEDLNGGGEIPPVLNDHDISPNLNCILPVKVIPLLSIVFT